MFMSLANTQTATAVSSKSLRKSINRLTSITLEYPLPFPLQGNWRGKEICFHSLSRRETEVYEGASRRPFHGTPYAFLLLSQHLQYSICCESCQQKVRPIRQDFQLLPFVISGSFFALPKNYAASHTASPYPEAANVKLCIKNEKHSLERIVR